MAHIFLYELQDFPFRAADKIRRLEYAGIGERGRQRLRPNRYTLTISYGAVMGSTGF